MLKWHIVQLNDAQMTHCTVKWFSNDTLYGNMIFKGHTVRLNDVQMTHCTLEGCSNDTLHG